MLKAPSPALWASRMGARKAAEAWGSASWNAPAKRALRMDCPRSPRMAHSRADMDFSPSACSVELAPALSPDTATAAWAATR